MPEDLPIYSEIPLRTSLQFADLDRLKTSDTSEVWRKADAIIGSMEGASNLDVGRSILQAPARETLIRAHSVLFSDRSGSGQLRTTNLPPLYRGQDCAPPEFIERSLDNMTTWLTAESFSQIHPVEACALSVARVVDIWPFEFGNLTVAILLGNSFLEKSGLAPFFVLPEHTAEFQKAISQSMTIDMQPLINAIYRTVRKELEALAKR